MSTHVGFRAVHADFTSSNGYRWPYPGQVATAPLPDGRQFTRGCACPQFVGDGICVAKTFRGAASGGIPAITCLIVEWDDLHVLGEDDDKVRVSDCRVLEVIDWPLLARTGYIANGADLTEADLTGANLRGADLTGADLTGADLTRANLTGANLTRAYLRGADLREAYLTGAYLREADLREANLTGANLRGADLAGAYLRGADLRGADLTGAYLREAYLTGAYLRGADLTGADLREANLTRANLTGALHVPDLGPKWVIGPNGIVVSA